jgi:glycosyltransferase involved in cell wall biosynthesis
VVLQRMGIRHVAVPMTRTMTPVADAQALVALFHLFRRERFTIVHCHTPKAELLGQLAARLAGVPIVVDTFRGGFGREGAGAARRLLLAAAARVAVSCADRVLFQSRELMADAVGARLCAERRATHLGNGIDLGRYDRAALDESAVQATRDALRLDPARPVVGFVGRLAREKGLLDLFEAMRLVRIQRPGAQLLVVGSAEAEEADRVPPDAARRFGFGGDCAFAGMRTDLPLLYALMDVFVLPSHRESFPRVLMEAAAMGVPSVTTDIRGCREVVDHDRTGFLVPPGRARDLAGAILTLLRQPDVARQMGVAAREKARQSFDEEQVFATVRAAYAQLLTDHGLALPRQPQPASVARFPESLSRILRW